MRRPSPLALVLVVASAWLASCADPPSAPAEPVAAPRTVDIVATSPAAAWLMREMGIVGVRLVDGEGRTLLDEELVALVEADLVVRHGDGCDRFTDVLDLDPGRLLDLSSGADLLMKEGRRHSHGEEGEHSHEEPLPGSWLHPDLLARSLDLLVAQLEGEIDADRLAATRQRIATARGRLEGIRASLAGGVECDGDLAYVCASLEAQERPSGGGRLRLASTEPGAATSEGSLLLEGAAQTRPSGDFLSALERNLAALEAAR